MGLYVSEVAHVVSDSSFLPKDKLESATEAVKSIIIFLTQQPGNGKAVKTRMVPSVGPFLAISI